MSDFTFTQTPEYDSYAASSEHFVDILVTTIAEKDVDWGRAPLRVSAALDRSGSMLGRKLALVKRTMNFMVRQVDQIDKLGIVSYGSTVTEEAPLAMMSEESKKDSATAVQNIRAGEMTNLSGGLFRSIEQVKNDARDEDETNPGPVNCVLLFTDGLPNEGVTDLVALENAVVKALEGYPLIKLHTFGYGADHNARLLQRLAEIGGGNFYFIEKEDDMPTAFADAIGGLLSVVVQNVTLELRVASNDITIEQVITGFRTSRNEDGSCKILCNDLYSKERKDVIVRLKVPALSEAVTSQPVLEACLSYFDVSLGKSTSVEAVVCVDRPEEVPQNQVPHEDFADQRLRVSVYETMEEIASCAQNGDIDGALMRVKRSISEVDRSMSSNVSRCFRKKLGMIEKSVMLSAGSKKNRRSYTESAMESSIISMAHGIRNQRSTECYRTQYQQRSIDLATTYTMQDPPFQRSTSEECVKSVFEQISRNSRKQ